MEQTWKPTVAGILDIVSGALALISVLGMINAIIFIENNPHIDITRASSGVPVNVMPILWSIAILYLIIAILALIGGVYTLQRKKWGLALTGSIAITIFWFFVGIPTIVFTAQSKNEFY